MICAIEGCDKPTTGHRQYCYKHTEVVRDALRNPVAETETKRVVQKLRHIPATSTEENSRMFVSLPREPWA
jgi:ABC-type lipoprotein export system ATPase subunit